MPDRPPQQRTAFVLGGGGMLGSSEVGMLKALVERGIRADVVLGTSVGAINGAYYAADPAPVAVSALEQLWKGVATEGVLAGSTLRRVTTLARTRTHAHAQEPLREMLERQLGDVRIEDLEIPFQCVAASIERAAERWFDSGPLVEAVLASSAVPGMLPPVQIDGEHFLDGGLVHSIPVGRAVALGATCVYVLQVGRIERPLEPPRRPWDVAVVAFEIARRHRFASDMAAVPPGVTVHVLPTGDVDLPRPTDLTALRYRETSRVVERIDRAYVAAAAYLSEQES
ncbi:MAG TPA: patatin-like phospholipase family protein [Jiangellales bacterium]|nr:patatin-like phospholipase family protein [Jiangellales bacterium]